MAMERPPWAALAMLCPKDWLPEGFDRAGKEDYCVCFLQHSRRGAFPGGPLTLADRALARSDDREGEVFLGLRICALRRGFEATGMMLAANAPPSFARRELQKILLREGPLAFHAFLDDWGIRLRPFELLELSWLLSSASPLGEEHIFLAQVPDAEEAAWAAGGENVRLRWATPSRLLQMHSRQEVELTLAQWYVLHELASCLPRLVGLPELQRANDGPSCLWTAKALKLVPAKSGPKCLLLPGDEEHPECPGAKGQRHRFRLRAGSEAVRSLERSRL
ncbi:unnamed protein product [Effrenium voratum]|nr:unnamed protein product [Effrenium voratum]